MAKLVYGERIGKQGKLTIGCSASLFDPTRSKLLLTRRTDNGQWCLPGGLMEPGESAAEACIREVWEETGLHVQIVRLIGLYSNPHRLLTYDDGNRYHNIALHFEALPLDGTLALSNETTAYGYFSVTEIAQLALMDHHHERIADTFAAHVDAFVR